MKLQDQAPRVLERTSAYLKSGLLKQKPAWFDVVTNHPPASDFTKKPKVILNQKYSDPHQYKARNQTRIKPRAKNASKVHAVPTISLFEDKLRDLFYEKHPWEFSRPKILIENDGNDNEKCDWSHMLQLHKPLDGESVVQRTIWLLRNEKLQLVNAYDKARFEFYQLRMKEEIFSLTSREQSNMFGAMYASTMLDHGIKEEQIFVDEWAKVAGEKTRSKKANLANKVSPTEGVETAESLFESDSFEIGDNYQPETENQLIKE